jgi:Domain of unknown function (DUF4160)
LLPFRPSRTQTREGGAGLNANNPALDRAFFYSNERGEPPHIHVRSGGFEAKFWLHDLSVAINAGFPTHEIGAIIRHLRPHRDVLEGKWHEHFGN